MTSGTMYSGYGCQKRIYWDVNKVVNYFKHHYGFQFISASCKCRPIKVCKHLRDTSVTGVVAGHKSSSLSLCSLNHINIPLSMRCPDNSCILYNWLNHCFVQPVLNCWCTIVEVTLKKTFSSVSLGSYLFYVF